MFGIPNDTDATDLFKILEELAEQQKAIDALRRRLIATRCKNCQRFGTALKTIRKRHHVSQRSLSLAIGYQHASKVNKWEAGKEFPRRDELLKIINILRCGREETALLGLAWWCDPLRPGNYY